ncbi:hypothetical protein ACGFMO_13440 [Streptomyces niveus]|uniref:hypothetical protein n=1 Tax=Streptomyces niveus TaxID=193462 RepID=UPI00371AA345
MLELPDAAAAPHYVRFPGIFALANGLARDGGLTPEQWRFWRTNNDWYDAAYPDPTTVYVHTVNPGAVLARVPGYLDLLAAHDVACVRLRSEVAPGRVVYEDTTQVVVVPPPA